MKPNVDQFIMVYDFEGAGYANFSRTHVQQLLPMLQTVFCDRQYCTLLIRQNWTIQAIQTVVDVFIHPRTKQKFRMFGSDWQNKLKELVDDDNLPAMYGGNREDF